MGRFTARPQEEAVEHAVAAAARFSTSGPHLLYADRSPVRGPKPYSTGSLEAVTEPFPCSETWFSTRRETSMARQRWAALTGTASFSNWRPQAATGRSLSSTHLPGTLVQRTA